MIMKTLAAWALVLTVFAGCSFAAEKSPVVQLRDSNGDAFCSGFVINTEQKIVLTADHCVSDGAVFTIDDSIALEFNHDPKMDYALLFVPDLDSERPALKMRTEPFKPGQVVRMQGYVREAFIDIKGFVYSNQVVFSNPDTKEEWGPFTMYFPQVIGGMSGGPILDENGKVIGMNQNASDQPEMSLSTPIKLIFEKIAKYWPVE